MRQPYGLSAQLTTGTPNPNFIDDLPVSGLLVTATVAGTAQVMLSGGTTVPIAFPVGTVSFNDLAVIEIVSTTGTATFYQLAAQLG